MQIKEQYKELIKQRIGSLALPRLSKLTRETKFNKMKGSQVAVTTDSNKIHIENLYFNKLGIPKEMGSFPNIHTTYQN